MRKRSHINSQAFFTLLLFCFTLANIFNIIKLAPETIQKNAELAKLTEKREKQQETNQKLSKQSLEDNDGYIEQKARELNYVYPEEHIFIDISGDS